MRVAHVLLGLACGLAVTGVLPGCISDGPRPARSVQRSQGAVIQYTPPQVWEQAKRSLATFGQSAKFDEARRLGVAYFGLGSVTVSVEPYDRQGTKTILRLVAQAGGEDAPEVAERVQVHIQQALLRIHR